MSIQPPRRLACGAPIAAQKPHKVKFGFVEGENRGPNPINPPLEIEDPFFWLRDDKREDPEVLAHLRLEEQYFKERTKDLEGLSQRIYDEHISHIKETDTTAPYTSGAFSYYRRTVKGLSYHIHCRVPKGAEAGGDQEEVLLDENKLAEGKSHCSVYSVEPSPDHTLVAYSVDFTGDELYTIKFLGDTVEDEITNTSGSIAFGADNSVVFYSTKDEAKRDYKVWRHVIGEPQANDKCLATEDDDVYSIGCSRSSDGKTLFIYSGSSETSEISLIDLEAGADAEIEPILPRNHSHRYDVALQGKHTLYILEHNAKKCINGRVIKAPRPAVGSQADLSNVIVPHDDSLFLEDIDVFATAAIFGGREGGLTQVYTLALTEGAKLQRVEMPDPVYTVEIVHSHNREYEADFFRICYSSPTTPSTWFDVQLAATNNKSTVKLQEVGGGFDSSKYVCERIDATAADGTKVPMSILRLKDLDMTKPHPTMLYGYGSYGICIEPEFSIAPLPYVDRGMIYAVGHIRGGGEMGRAWFELGAKYLTKRNTFTDFIACAEELIERGMTTKEQLGTEGRSAGGLLMGAVLNMRPDLFSCAIAGVPFVDVMVSMCDPSIPLTTGEWEEWGNPNEWTYFDYMKSYSPMDNICAQPYPHIFIHAGLNDPRVAYWEPAKWASKLRLHKTDSNEVVMKMEMDSGHFSASDRYKYWREKALQQAFVIKHTVKKLE